LLKNNIKFFSSLRFKIAFTYLLVIGIGFVVANASIIKIFELREVNEKKERFHAYAIQVAQAISNNYASTDVNIKADIIYTIEELGNEISYQEGRQPTRILVLDRSGIVEFDSYNDLGPNGFLRRNLAKQFPIIERVLEGEDVDPTPLYIDTFSDQKWVMYAYAPITHELHGIIGMVILSTSLSDVDEMLSTISSMLNRYLLIILLCVAIISFLIAGYITQPIKELTAVIRKMSQGHLDQRVRVKGGGELRELGEAFNIMSEKLENLDRARNEFVSNASHELKTPLSAIKVLAESLLHMGGDVPDIYKEFLNDINNEIDRLNAIISDLLTLVHIDNKNSTLKKQNLDLAELTQKTVKGLQVLAEKNGITLDMNLEGPLEIIGDEAKLRQVIINLVDNAIKYTPEGGRVMVDTYRGKNEAILKVSDTGIGIPAEDIPRIFDRFFRVDKARSRATGGTGLGLSIAHRIILLHNGSIQVDSREGKGTTFYVHFPLVN
jgi:signal transduction histidine kinase